MSLQTKLDALRRARRINTGLSVADDVVHNIISANTAGDNTLVPTPGRPIEVLEIHFWNGVGAQTLVLRDGALPLSQWTNLPAGGGIFLGFAGNGQPHFKVSAGNDLPAPRATPTCW
jgi:hypothetical protein